ncbi:MAG: undecaprenyl-diphosphate phosphatase [Oscillospiraceae bacterium]|nr:undecaprenyl-diphosphate phosphatase [Oscillospiraceae bacterium]
MSVLLAALLGLIQGLTEFLPVSSSGHLSIIQNIFSLGYDSEEHLLFDVMLHVATLVSVYIVYRKEITEMATDTFNAILGRDSLTDDSGRMKPTVRGVFLLFVATLPLALVVFVHGFVEKLYYNTFFIVLALAVTGGLLFASTHFNDGKKTEKTATVKDALLVGLGQAIATLPGLSRSGTTITVGMTCGFRKSFAVRFSFLLSIPAILGSTILTLVSALRDGVNWGNVPAYIIGMVVAGVVGFFSLSFFKQLVQKGSLKFFAYYCWAASVVALIVSIVT